MSEYEELEALLQHYFKKKITDFKQTLDEPLKSELLIQ
jgi:hypothetical protein